MRALWGMALNDLKVWMRSPSAIAAALLPALGMGVLVAVLTNSVGQQPVALVRKGQGAASIKMANLIKGDPEAYLITEMTPAEAESAIGDQRVAAIIVIPSNFDSSVVGATASVDVYLNNVDIDLADDIRRSVTRSVAEFDAPQLGLQGEKQGPTAGVLFPNPYRIAIAEHDLRESNVSFLQYQVIPIVLLIVISVGLLGTSLLTARDFERGTSKLLVLSPVRPSTLVAGRLLGGTLITLALITPLILLGFVTHRIPYCSEESSAPLWLVMLFSGPCGWILPVPSASHGLALIALLLAVTLMTVGLGTLLGVWLRDTRLVTMTGLNGSAYLFFLGGGFTTVAFLPGWLQVASRFVPTSYAIEGLRQALFYPDLIGFGTDMIVLTGSALLSAAVASRVMTRALTRV